MGINPYVVIGSAIVGLLVGLTGAGGGALMTPMLILLFGVKPSAAISSDLVAAVLMRPVGAVVHLQKGTVNLRLVGWMCAGSVPMAFLGSYLLHLLGNSDGAQANVERALGAALLAGSAAMVLRYFLDRRSGQRRDGQIGSLAIRPLPSVAIGMTGGLIVGLTSVGSGSLMIVLLLFTYPLLSAGQLVGTDLTQAVPLTAAAALGALAFGHVQFGLTTAIVIGSVPAVLIGSFLSSRAPDRYVRPAITFVIFASGLKYVGLGTTQLGWVLCAVLLAAAAYWLVRVRPWQTTRALPSREPLPAPVLRRGHASALRAAAARCALRAAAGRGRARGAGGRGLRACRIPRGAPEISDISLYVLSFERSVCCTFCNGLGMPALASGHSAQDAAYLHFRPDIGSSVSTRRRDGY